MKALALLLLLAGTALARIGETPEQCELRYGEGVKAAKDVIVFTKAEYAITACFFDGQADIMMFTKPSDNQVERLKELSENEITAFLAANGAGKIWQKKPASPLKAEWATEDGSLVATYNELKRMLLILTKGAVAREDARKKAKEDKGLQGF